MSTRGVSLACDFILVFVAFAPVIQERLLFGPLARCRVIASVSNTPGIAGCSWRQISMGARTDPRAMIRSTSHIQGCNNRFRDPQDKRILHVRIFYLPLWPTSNSQCWRWPLGIPYGSRRRRSAPSL